jgi:hypothetical protein
MERWRIEENGGRLFRRPKLTPSCSAERKETASSSFASLSVNFQAQQCATHIWVKYNFF